MKSLKIFLLSVVSFLLVFSFPVVVFADETGVYSDPGSTVLPDTKFSVSKCEEIMVRVNILTTKVFDESQSPNIRSQIASREASIDLGGNVGSVSYTDILACSIKTGEIKMWMVPFFIRFILEFIIGLAGLVSVAGVVYGGYLYLFAGISDDKDKGKNAIKNSVIGLVLSLTAWAIVNVVISFITA
jgi:hypothetical protein